MASHIHPEKIAKDLSGVMDVVARYGVPIQFPTTWSQFPGCLFYGNSLWVDDKIGADRIMFGTDWSATWRWLSVPMTLHQTRLKVLDDARLTPEEREHILWKAAAKLMAKKA